MMMTTYDGHDVGGAGGGGDGDGADAGVSWWWWWWSLLKFASVFP